MGGAFDLASLFDDAIMRGLRLDNIRSELRWEGTSGLLQQRILRRHRVPRMKEKRTQNRKR